MSHRLVDNDLGDGLMLKDRTLYIALSELFIDNEVDYHYIASVAKLFPIEYVKTTLFYYIAPSCYHNFMTPVPPVWTYFDEEQLLYNIATIKKKQLTISGRIQSYCLSIYLGFKFKHEWQTLLALL